MLDTRNTRFFSKINKFYLGEIPENSKNNLGSANDRKDEGGIPRQDRAALRGHLHHRMTSLAYQLLRAAARVTL
jgi:hypothetical protein